jgi:hypothetical protein
VRQGVLDGGLLSGPVLEEVDGVNRRELELVPLGELPLAHGFCPEAPVLVGSVPGRPAQAGAWGRCWCPIEVWRRVLGGFYERWSSRCAAGATACSPQPTGSRGSMAASWPWWWRIGRRTPGPPCAAGPWDLAPQVAGLMAPQFGGAGAAGRLAGAPGAAPHRPGAGADGRVATAGGLEVCAPCINPSHAAPNASGVPPHGFRQRQTSCSSPCPHASPAAPGQPKTA